MSAAHSFTVEDVALLVDTLIEAAREPYPTDHERALQTERNEQHRAMSAGDQRGATRRGGDARTALPADPRD